jgi:hypothetical protein
MVLRLITGFTGHKLLLQIITCLTDVNISFLVGHNISDSIVCSVIICLPRHVARFQALIVGTPVPNAGALYNFIAG